MTNKDRINKMSIEELARFLDAFGCCECTFNSECSGYCNCIEGHKKWLEQEVDEKWKNGIQKLHIKSMK